MIHAILTAIALLVLGCCWVLYLRNIELFLCILIVIYSEFFYLVPQIKGPDDYKLVLLPIVIILMIESFFRRKLAFGRYGGWVISFLIISLFGIIVANFSGQSFILGIKAAKFIPLLMIYFVLAGRPINIEKFTNYLIIVSLAVAAIATAQFLLRERINLFPGLPLEKFSGNVFERSAVFRVTVGEFIIPMGALVALARYGQRFRLSFLFAAIALFLEVLFIQQTRMLIAALFLSMVIVYALSHRLTVFRLAAYILLAGVFLATTLFFSASDFKDVSLVKRTTTDFAKRRGSYQARIDAYNYYWGQILDRPVVGHGILNFNWEGNKEKKLRQLDMHLSDIGMIHFIVQAGIIGLVWLVYGIIKGWCDIIRYRKYLLVSSYFIIATFTSPTIDMLLRTDSLFLFALFLGLFSSAIVFHEDDISLERS